MKHELQSSMLSHLPALKTMCLTTSTFTENLLLISRLQGVFDPTIYLIIKKLLIAHERPNKPCN